MFSDTVGIYLMFLPKYFTLHYVRVKLMGTLDIVNTFIFRNKFPKSGEKHFVTLGDDFVWIPRRHIAGYQYQSNSIADS